MTGPPVAPAAEYLQRLARVRAAMRGATAQVRAGFAYTSVVETDLLERPLPEPVSLTGTRLSLRPFQLSLRPFQIVTLRFARG